MSKKEMDSGQAEAASKHSCLLPGDRHRGGLVGSQTKDDSLASVLEDILSDKLDSQHSLFAS